MTIAELEQESRLTLANIKKIQEIEEQVVELRNLFLSRIQDLARQRDALLP